MALVGHWKLDDTSGASSTVTATVGTDGTLVATVSAQPDDLHVGAGNGPGGALQDCGFNFDTSNNERVLLNKVGLTGAYSLAYWVKSSDTSQSYFHLDNRDGANDGFIALRSGTASGLQYLHENDGAIAAGPELHDNAWHHVLCVYDGSTGLEAFVDGSSIGTDTTAAGGVAVDTAAAVIGARSYSPGVLNAMNGILADVRLYNSDESANVSTIRDFARPAFSVAASISGTDTQGEVKTVSFTVDDSSNVTYQWYRADDASGTNETLIATAESFQYALQAADVGKYVSCEVTATSNALLAATSQSEYDGPVSSSGGGGLPIPVAAYHYRQMAA